MYPPNTILPMVKYKLCSKIVPLSPIGIKKNIRLITLLNRSVNAEIPNNFDLLQTLFNLFFGNILLITKQITPKKPNVNKIAE